MLQVVHLHFFKIFVHCHQVTWCSSSSYWPLWNILYVCHCTWCLIGHDCIFTTIWHDFHIKRHENCLLMSVILIYYCFYHYIQSIMVVLKWTTTECYHNIVHDSFINPSALWGVRNKILKPLLFSFIHLHSMDPYMARKQVDMEVVNVNKTSHINNIIIN
jgi:hypothetical protein